MQSKRKMTKEIKCYQIFEKPHIILCTVYKSFRLFVKFLNINFMSSNHDFERLKIRCEFDDVYLNQKRLKI